MRQWSFLVLAALAVGAPACARNPAPEPPAPAVPAPVDPVGSFDFTTAIEGSVVNGTVTVTKTDTGFGGSVTTNLTDPIPVRTVVVEGQKMTVTADTPDGPVVIILEFQGDEFSGSWTLGATGGTHTGKRRKT